MKIEPTSAAKKAPQRGRWPTHCTAAAVPTRTGAIAAGRGLGLAAISQILMRRLSAPELSRPPRELGEVRLALLLEGLAPLGGLLAAVEEQVGVVGVEAGLCQAQGEGREREHVAAPGDRLPLELVERDDGVNQSHPQRLLGVVLAAEQPELLRLLGSDQVAQEGGAEAAVPGADPRPRLPEDGVVGGDREVAADVEDVTAADRVTGDHRHHGLRQPPHLHLQVGDVEAAERGALGDVAAVAPDRLVAAGAERLRALAGEDDRADLGVLACQLQRGRDLDQRLRAEGVQHLWPVDRDLGDPVGLLVADVAVLGGAPPLDRRVEILLGWGVLVAVGHDGTISRMKLDDWLAQRTQSCPDRTALVADGAEMTYAELEAEATWVARRLAAHGVRRGSTAALTMHPRREQVVLAHALMKVGARMLPLSPRLTMAERAAIVAAEEPIVDPRGAGGVAPTRADTP